MKPYTVILVSFALKRILLVWVNGPSRELGCARAKVEADRQYGHDKFEDVAIFDGHTASGDTRDNPTMEFFDWTYVGPS